MSKNTRLLKIQVQYRQKLQKQQIKHGYKVYSREWREYFFVWGDGSPSDYTKTNKIHKKTDTNTQTELQMNKHTNTQTKHCIYKCMYASRNRITFRSLSPLLAGPHRGVEFHPGEAQDGVPSEWIKRRLATKGKSVKGSGSHSEASLSGGGRTFKWNQRLNHS